MESRTSCRGRKQGSRPSLPASDRQAPGNRSTLLLNVPMAREPGPVRQTGRGFCHLGLGELADCASNSIRSLHHTELKLRALSRTFYQLTLGKARKPHPRYAEQPRRNLASSGG